MTRVPLSVLIALSGTTTKVGAWSRAVATGASATGAAGGALPGHNFQPAKASTARTGNSQAHGGHPGTGRTLARRASSPAVTTGRSTTAAVAGTAGGASGAAAPASCVTGRSKR